MTTPARLARPFDQGPAPCLERGLERPREEDLGQHLGQNLGQNLGQHLGPPLGQPLGHEADPELDALVDRFSHRVRYFAHRVERRYGLDPAWRDDLISAGFFGLLKALRNRRAEAHPHELSAYISKRVEGAVLDEARQALGRSAQEAELDPADLDDGLSLERGSSDWHGRDPGDPEDLVDGLGRWRQIEGSFEHLEEAHRSWLLAVASGHTLAEIARSSGASPARIQNQMSRITRSVRANTPELRRLLRHEI